MSEPTLISIDELIQRCGYFRNGAPVNNGYGCDHPQQREQEDGHGKCFQFSCPLATAVNPEREPEDREYFGEDWQSYSDGLWLLWDGTSKPPVDHPLLTFQRAFNKTYYSLLNNRFISWRMTPETPKRCSFSVGMTVDPEKRGHEREMGEVLMTVTVDGEEIIFAMEPEATELMRSFQEALRQEFTHRGFVCHIEE